MQCGLPVLFFSTCSEPLDPFSLAAVLLKLLTDFFFFTDFVANPPCVFFVECKAWVLGEPDFALNGERGVSTLAELKLVLAMLLTG